jgi:hypothetical protein
MQMKASVSLIRLSASAIPRMLLYALGTLTAFHLGVVVFHLLFGLRMEAYTQLFDLDLEANLPTYFNSLLFFLCALLTLVIAMDGDDVLRKGWFTLCGIFIFLGIDEGSQIHEKLMFATLRLMNHGSVSGTVFGWLYYAWVIPYGIAAVGLGLWLARWFIAINSGLRNALVVSGAVYVFGAVFLEMLSGKIAEGLLPSIMTPAQMAYMPCSTYASGTCHLYVSPLYILVYTCEEVCEMLGLIMAVHALIRWLRKRNTVMELSFAAQPQQDRIAHIDPEMSADDLSGGRSRVMIHGHQAAR